MKSIHLAQSIIDPFPADAQQLLVGVSGGVDSVVLLHTLKDVSERLNVSLHVAHLDHQIRSESSNDAAFVRDLCGQWDIPCYAESYDVAELAERGKLSIEMAGRQARREFFQRIAEMIEADAIVLAHHLDDQLETFLIRLLRGSGQSGLAAMRIHTGIWWRPLLGCSRGQILEYAQKYELRWVEDQSNNNPVFLRNQLRHQLIPQLLEINSNIAQKVAGLTQQIQVEEDYWQELITQQFNDLVISCNDGLRLRRGDLLVMHPALRMRMLREALRRLRGDLQRIEAVHLHSIEMLLTGQRSQAQLDLPGCWVARRYETLWLRDVAPKLPERFDLSLPLPGELELPDGRILRSSIQDEQEGESTNVAEYSLALLPHSLRVRSWQAGDRFEPLGMTGRKRLKNYFSDCQIELEARLKTPLLVSGETILWVIGMRRSNYAVAGKDKGMILRVELI
ncbi:MAG: tRNA lysidine(34) synthetase TilS [Desulfuromusa sp.]|jgi:tRNA(Ile)-lysidine synthase|nr:tRNA lysidine(34) synthetase TilS [Desulfuromusa sp.]